jgi:hypothetical protein
MEQCGSLAFQFLATSPSRRRFPFQFVILLVRNHLFMELEPTPR